MKWKCLAIITMLTGSIHTFCAAQTTDTRKAARQQPSRFFLGAGLGLDYGSIGFKAAFEPISVLGIFGGAGYNFAGIGTNAGVSFNLLPDKKVTPTAIAMYGHNASIVIWTKGTGSRTLLWADSYVGFTFGGGADIKWGRRPQKLSLLLLVPLRNAEFHKDYAEAGIYSFPGVFPVTLSIGWNFNIL